MAGVSSGLGRGIARIWLLVAVQYWIELWRSMMKDQRSMMKEQEGSRYLPEELWTQILCFFPVKSLLVLRSVCKLFQSIIDSSNFVSLHLRCFPDNLHESLTFFHRYEFVNNDIIAYYNGLNHYEIRESNGFALRSMLDIPELSPSDFVYLSGSLDGLFLLRPIRGPQVTMLWNPSMRQIRNISLQQQLQPTISRTSRVWGARMRLPFCRTKSSGWIMTGLAYDSSCRDYKILCIAYYVSHPLDVKVFGPSGVWIYRVKTRSWTIVNMKNSGMCTLPGQYCCNRCPLFFDGDLLWIEAVYSDQEEDRPRMVRFEVGTHKFRYYANLPVENHKITGSMLVMLDGGSTLGLCGLDVEDQVSIWAVALDGDVCSWVKRCTCIIPQYPNEESMWRTPGYGAFVRISKNEELMWEYFTSDETLKVYTYNLRTHHFQMSVTNPSNSRIKVKDNFHCAYIQNLIKV